jgi:hypothetical protein
MQDLLYRIRDSLSLPIIIALSIGAIGVGMTIVVAFAPLGWGISEGLARLLTYFGCVLIVIGVVAGVLATWKFIKSPIGKREGIYSIISILSDMANRLWQLAEEEKGKSIDWEKYKETNKKIIELMGVSVPEVRTVDEVKNAIEVVERELAEKYSRKKRTPRSKKIMIIRPIGLLLDGDGFGLREQRGLDKSYSQLNQLVDRYYDDYKDVIDERLNLLIRSHINFAEFGANMLLAMYRVRVEAGLAPYLHLLPPSIQSGIEGFEDDIRDILRDIRIDIARYIRKLKK